MDMTKKQHTFTYEVGIGHISWANFQRRETTTWEYRKMLILHVDDEEYCITVDEGKSHPNSTLHIHTFHRTGGEEWAWHVSDSYRDLLIYLWYEEFS